jgi:3-oxoacyl-[acyl-carrier-protein] synthase-3
MQALPFASRMTGIGSAFPAQRVTNHDLAKFVDTNDEWIRERTGIIERRLVEKGNPDEFNSSLGFRAATRALEMAGKRAEDIDAILYATCSPDTLVPSTACWLQQKLGATRAWGVDLNAACSGFIFGSSIADTYISSGRAKTVLVVGCDVTSAYVNWKDRTSCVLFGDGAGAAIFEQTSPTNPRRVLSTHMQTDGTLTDILLMPAGGSARAVTEEDKLAGNDKYVMKGKEIFKNAVKTLADYAVIACEANQLKLSDIDWFIPHQANMRIIEAVAKRLEFPMEKILINIDRHGNTSAATVPTVIDEAVRDGRIQPGQTLLMDAFGAGLTYGSMVVRW